MLARNSAEAFDSQQHLFEIKWDGFRGIARADGETRTIVSRRQQDLTERFPELECLAALPEGTILDGEIVILRDGRPDFTALLARERRPTRHAAPADSATYVVFDLLYHDHAPLLEVPLRERRERLRELVDRIGHPSMLFSEGVVGNGRTFFEHACERDLEGAVAKDLDSRYLPGKRSDAWLKIKRVKALYCLVLGYLPEGKNDFKSLLVATELDGVLRYVGRVGGGFDAAQRADLNRRLREQPRAQPLVACEEKGRWIEPGLFCKVKYLEVLPSGMLRAPVFGGVVESA